MAQSSRPLVSIATALEFILILTLLSLFAGAYPERIRNTLWHEGGEQGWNSDPIERVYLYANHKAIPPVPAIWDKSTAQCNLCIVVVTVVVWFTRFFVREKAIGTQMTLAINAFYDIVLAALWAYSAGLQNSGDFTDPQHISLRPWYLQHGCTEARPKSQSACQVAKACFRLSVFSVVWFCARFFGMCLVGAYRIGKNEGGLRKSVGLSRYGSLI